MIGRCHIRLVCVNYFYKVVCVDVLCREEYQLSHVHVDHGAQPSSSTPSHARFVMTKRPTVTAADIIQQAIARNAEKKAGRPLTEFRRHLLEAVDELGEHAYGHLIAQLINAKREKRVSYPQVYTTLERLEEAGYLTSKRGTSAVESARKVTIYTLTEKATLALAA